MAIEPLSAAAARLQRDVLRRIPLAAAMRIEVADYDAARLVLAAPLAPNLNHIGTGFGGAIGCIGTLACWGLAWLGLDEPQATIVIQDGETDFLAPITGGLRAEARAPDALAWQRFVNQFDAHARSRIELTASVGTADSPRSAVFRGRFVASRQPCCEATSRRRLQPGRERGFGPG